MKGESLKLIVKQKLTTKESLLHNILTTATSGEINNTLLTLTNPAIIRLSKLVDKHLHKRLNMD